MSNISCYDDNTSLHNSSLESDNESQKTKKTHIEDESAEEEEEEDNDEFIPIPYIFTLKDIFDKPITLQPDLSENCKISCPPFHILLDHTIAVLWTIFSGENTQILQTSHIHWALKFLEGLKDKQNKQTDDIKMAISYLQDILIDMISNLDLSELKKRNEQSLSDRTSQYKSTNYSDFEAYANKSNGDDACGNITDKVARCECECRHSTRIEGGQQQEDDGEEFHSALDDNPPQSLNEKCNSKLHGKKEYPSFILEDMLGKTNPEQLKDIINNTICADKLIDTEKPTKLDSPSHNAEPSKANQISEDILNWRENQYNKIIKQLQQMSQLEESFKNMKCSGSSDIIEKLEQFINQPDPNC